MIDQLFYISAATRPHDESVVQAILAEARHNNPKRDLTGCLLYSGLYFAQVLEARADVIDRMIEHLSCDPRHVQVRMLSRTSSSSRDYASWSMGYMHSLDMQDALRALLVGEPVDFMLMESTRRSIRPDPLTGLV